LQSVPPPTKSGYARIAFELSRWFTEKGHEVEVITESRGCSRIGQVAVLNDEGKSIFDKGADIVQIIGPTPLFTEQCVSYAKKRNLKVVYTINALPGISSFYHYPGASIVDGLYEKMYLRRKMKPVDLAVFNTHDFAKSCRFYRGKNEIIPYGINGCNCTVSKKQDLPNLDFSNSTNQNSLRILFVGQLRKYKGVNYQLYALKDMRERGYTGAILRIVGEGPDKQELASMIKALDLEDCAFLLGGIRDEDLHRMYLDSDVIVLPSIGAESFGIVLVEGAAHGLKVIASDLPGVRELVKELNGIVVPPKDSSALSAALIETVNNLNAPLNTQKQNFNDSVQSVDLSRFLWKRIAQDYLDVYQRLLAIPVAASEILTLPHQKLGENR
jgi:glycosyltransferase involved in cell wall biosynthesis